MKKLVCLLTVLLALSGVMMVALVGPGIGSEEADAEPAVAADTERRSTPISPARQQTKNHELRRVIRQETE